MDNTQAEKIRGRLEQEQGIRVTPAPDAVDFPIVDDVVDRLGNGRPDDDDDTWYDRYYVAVHSNPDYPNRTVITVIDANTGTEHELTIRKIG
jgi:hypothetical protein